MYDTIRHSARFRVLIDRVGLGRFAPLIVGRSMRAIVKSGLRPR
jgi:hypothetical protein